MNQHLGVGDVVAAAYRFGFERGLILIRLFWAPMIAIIGLEVAFMALMAAYTGPDGDLRFTGSPLVYMAVFYGAMFLFTAVILFIAAGATAAYYRLAALGEEPKGVFFIRFDGPSVRTALAMILSMLVLYATLLAPVVTTIVIATKIEWASWQGQFVHAAPRGLPASSLLAILASYLFGLVLTLYFGVRLSTLAPVAAVENRISLGRAWSLASGKVLPMVGAYVLTHLASILGFFVGALALVTVNLAIAVVGSLMFAGGDVFGIVGLIVIGAIAIGAYIAVIATHAALPAIIYRRLVEIDAADD